MTVQKKENGAMQVDAPQKAAPAKDNKKVEPVDELVSFLFSHKTLI
jgi:hypothetical protein